MRELITTDLGHLTKIIKKMGIKDSLKELFKDFQEKKKKSEKYTETDFAMDLVFMFIENYDQAQNEIITFISSLDGRSIEDIKKLPLADMIGLIQEMLSKDGIGDFFRLVLR